MSVLLAVLAVCSVLAAPVVATAQDGVTDLGTAHPLAEDPKISEFERTGYTEGELDRYQIRLEAAEDVEDVGLSPAAASDLRNDYVRIQYEEDHQRTIRILLPREYITPYTQEEVDSLSSGHVASFEPAREGEYMAITVTVNGQADIVLPLQKDSAMSYSMLERVEKRVGSAIGISVLGRSSDWEYLEAEQLENDPAVPIDGSASEDDILIQYDGRPDASEEHWLNAPRGETSDVPVYYFVRDSDDRMYVVATGENPPAVRVKSGASRVDRLKGDINDLRLVPDRLGSAFDSGIPFFGGD